MWESQQEYAAKYRQGSTAVTPGPSPVSTSGMSVAREGSLIFIRDGKEYWVSKKGTWLEVATIPPSTTIHDMCGAWGDSKVPVSILVLKIHGGAPDTSGV